MITIVKDKDPIYDTGKYDSVLVGTSIYCMLTNGFQRKMSFKYYPELNNALSEGKYGDINKLGKYNKVIYGNSDKHSDSKLTSIYLLYICKFPNRNRETIDYDALENVLKLVNYELKGKNVMTTVLGCSIFDGNGNKDKVMEIINRVCKDINLFIYDYEQKTYAEEISEYEKKLKNELSLYDFFDKSDYRCAYYKRHDYFKKNFLEHNNG